MENLSDLRRQLDRRLARRQQLAESIKKEIKAKEVADEFVQTVTQAQQAIQEVAQQVQQQAHKQVARVVSKCLSAVFEQPYQLKIDFERKRGRTEAEFVYLCEGRKVAPRQTSGGVLDVAALALRLASLVLTIPQARRLLVLDEPFQGLSSKNLQKMAALIETLAKELDLQIIIVTHDAELQIGKVVEFT